jgi:hypothetical protein
MSDLSEQLSALLMKTADVMVPMDCTGTSAISITTEPLGPCISFLMYYHYIDHHSSTIKHQCTLHHFAFEEDETGLTVDKTLKKILARLLTRLQDSLNETSIHPRTHPSRELLKICLFVAGGDVDEVMNIHNALSRLNEIDIDKKLLFIDEEIDFLFSKLMNNVIVLKATSKILPDEELAYQNDYPPLLV